MPRLDNILYDIIIHHTTKGGIGSKPWSIHQELVPLSAGYMIVEGGGEKRKEGEIAFCHLPLNRSYIVQHTAAKDYAILEKKDAGI